MKKKILVLVMFLFALVGLVACTGPQGEAGEPGKDAYQIACEQGFVGTVEEWLESLKGAQGQQGKQGAAGEEGQMGNNGQEMTVFTYDGGVYWSYTDKEGNPTGERQLMWYYIDTVTITYCKRDFTDLDTLKTQFFADLSEVAGSEITLDNLYDTYKGTGTFMGNSDGKAVGLMADHPDLFNKYSFFIKWIYEFACGHPENQFYQNDSGHKYELATLEAFGLTISSATSFTSRSNNIKYGEQNILANICNFFNGNGETEGTSEYYPTADFTGVDRTECLKVGSPLKFDGNPAVVKRSDLATYALPVIAKNDPCVGQGWHITGWTDVDGNPILDGQVTNFSQDIFAVVVWEGIFVTLLPDNKEVGAFSADPMEHVDPSTIVDPVHEGQEFLGWFEEGKRVEPADMLDGHTYQARWGVKVHIDFGGAIAYTNKEDIIKDFIADVSAAYAQEVTVDTFYDTFNSESHPFMGVGEFHEGAYPVFGLCADHPELIAKWGWLIEYCTNPKADSYWNAALIAYGLNYKPGDTPKTAPGKYANRYLIMNIQGFMTGTNFNQGGDSHAAVDWSNASLYEGFDAIACTHTDCFGHMAPAPATEEFTSNIDALMEGVVYPGHIFLGFYAMSDTEKKVLSLEEMTSLSETYVAKWAEGAIIKLNGGTLDLAATIGEALFQSVNASAASATVATAATKDAFYDTFKANMDVIGADSTFKANWEWFFAWIFEGTDNKRKYGWLDHFGYAVDADEYAVKNKTFDNYSTQFVANDLHNFITGTGATIHSGSSSSYPAADFTVDGCYDGLEEAVKAIVLYTVSDDEIVMVPCGFVPVIVKDGKRASLGTSTLVAGQTYSAKWDD